MSLCKDGCWQCWCDSDKCKGSETSLSYAEHDIDVRKSGAIKWLKKQGWKTKNNEWFCPVCSKRLYEK